MIAAGIDACVEDYLREIGRFLAKNDQIGLYKHLKSTVALQETKAGNQQLTRNEYSTLLRDKVPNREQGFGFYH